MKKIYIIFFEILLCINTNSMYSLSLKDIIEFLQNNDTPLNCYQPEEQESLENSCRIEKSKDMKDTIILTFSELYKSYYLYNYQIYLNYKYDGKDYKLNIIDQTINSIKSNYFDIERPVITEKEKDSIIIYLLVHQYHVSRIKSNYRLKVVISIVNNPRLGEIITKDIEKTLLPYKNWYNGDLELPVEQFKDDIERLMIKVPTVKSKEDLVYIYSNLMDHVILCTFDGCKENMFIILENILRHRDKYLELPLILKIEISDFWYYEMDYNLNSKNGYQWCFHYILIYRTEDNKVYVIDPLYRTDKLTQLAHIPLLSNYLDEIDPEHKSHINLFTYNH